MKKIRIILLLILFQITGCALTSTPVSTIGLRHQSIEAFKLLHSDPMPQTWIIKENSYRSALANHGSVGFPYKSIRLNRKEYEKEFEFEVTVDFIEGVKDFESNTVSVVVNGSEIEFERDKATGHYYLFRKYRKPSGYLAQSLQVVAIPVDLTLTALLGVAALVAVPISYISGVVGS